MATTLKVKSEFTFVTEKKDDKVINYFTCSALGAQRIYLNSGTEYIEEVQLVHGTVYSGTIYCNAFVSQQGSLILSAMIINFV